MRDPAVSRVDSQTGYCTEVLDQLGQSFPGNPSSSTEDPLLVRLQSALPAQSRNLLATPSSGCSRPRMRKPWCFAVLVVLEVQGEKRDAMG
jgi:hypothetical protein